jgi:hypothetical protein
MSERRSAQQDPHLDGRRATDPTLTPRYCASRIGMSTAFIINEIRGGHLRALVIKNPGRRVSRYRISPADFQTYLARYGWHYVA